MQMVFFSYIKDDHVVWGLAVTFILIKKGPECQGLFGPTAASNDGKGKMKLNQVLVFNLFVPLKLC